MPADTWATSACRRPAYLGGGWYAFDARYNTPRIGRVLMVRGRDAADGAMMTSFGGYELKLFRVWTDEVTGVGSDDDLGALLQEMPDAPALTLASAGTALARRAHPRRPVGLPLWGRPLRQLVVLLQRWQIRSPDHSLSKLHSQRRQRRGRGTSEWRRVQSGATASNFCIRLSVRVAARRDGYPACAREVSGARADAARAPG